MKGFIFVGEKSGDNIASDLLPRLQKSLPALDLFGVPGPKCRQGGVKVLMPMENFEVMGLTDVLTALPRLWKSFKSCRKAILAENPDFVLLVDYADFNQLMASSLRKKGYKGKIIQYVCPSIWAWRKGRKRPMQRNLDLLLCLLPFEEKLFQNSPLRACYVGNPVASIIRNYEYKDLERPDGEPLLGVFPGSRRTEILDCLPRLLESALIWEKRVPHLQIGISVASVRVRPLILEELKRHPFKKPPQLIPPEQQYQLMKESRAALAVCGTITLELALHKTPTVVVYHLSRVNRFLGQYIFKVRLPHYSLGNIVAEEEAFPELIEEGFDCQTVIQKLADLWENDTARVRCQAICEKICERMGREDPSGRAAEAITAAIAPSA